MADSKKKWSDHDMYARSQGVDYPLATYRAGEGMQRVRVTQAGASPFAFLFATYGLSDMEDALYDVVVQGPNGDERCDYATRTTTGFNITGGADTENLIVLIMGRLRGQVAP